MTITPIGVIFITLGFTTLAVRPAWLISLLFVSAVLQAFAVAIIGPASMGVGLGITPWLFTSVLIFIHFIAISVHRRRIDFGTNRATKLLLWGWFTFFAWCVFGAFSLPFIFKGTLVHPLSEFWGFDSPMKPLVWNPINAIQAVNVMIIGMVLLYVLQFTKDTNIGPRLIAGIIGAILVSLGISFYQKLGFSEAVSTPLSAFIQSMNPSYAPGDSLDRVYLPFSEPSYASSWYAGVSLGGLAVYLLSRSLWLGIFIFSVGLVALVITKGGTGFAGFIGGLFVLIFALTAIIWRGKSCLKHAFRRLALVAFIFCFTAISYQTARAKQPLLPDIYSAIQSVFQPRASGPISYRGQSNLDALTITINTWGVGVGLGSNRASSYLLSMSSNIGIPGLALFLLLLAYQLHYLLLSQTTNITLRILIVGGTIGMFSSMVIGIPDLMLPAWWIWLIAGFGFAASHQQASSTPLK